VGKLVAGKWLNDEQLLTFEQQQYKAVNGRFQRGTSIFRNWITADGSAGISGERGPCRKQYASCREYIGIFCRI